MRFKSLGKTYQLLIESSRDLRLVSELDESLWVVTSAPAKAFRCDPGFLSFLDADGDGRITTAEIKQAVRWMFDHLSNDSGLGEETIGLPLAFVREEAPEGKQLLRGAKYVHRSLGLSDQAVITLEQVRRFTSNLRMRPLNGDGVIPPEAAGDDAETAQYIRDVMATVGDREDASGSRGLTATEVDLFQAEAQGWLEWRRRAAMPDAGGMPAVLPFGSRTADIFGVYREQAERVDLFFQLCRAVKFEPRAASRLGCLPTALEGLDFTKPEDVRTCLEQAPIARPAPCAELPLDEAVVNPLHAGWVTRFKRDVLAPVLGRTPASLGEADWERVKSALAPYAGYLAERRGQRVQSIDAARLESYASGAHAARAKALVQKDAKVAGILEDVRRVEKLLLYRALFMRFANNFVNLTQLYSNGERALFECGSAVIDGRWFNLALPVSDLPAHRAAAGMSNVFTFYLEVAGRGADGAYTVAVPTTSGSRGNLFVGKRGVFFDVEGVEHDARILHIIENPISISEALQAPFVRLWSFVVGKIEAMGGSSEKGLQESADGLLQASAPGKPPAASPLTGGPGALLVGLSVSAAAVGSAFAFMTKTFTVMSKGQVFSGLIGAVLVVLFPVSLIAMIKLSRQDISSLMEGSGWAVNARLRFTWALRRQFTRRAPYPAAAQGVPRFQRAKLLVLAVLLLVLLGAGLRHWRGGRGAERTAESGKADPAREKAALP